MPVGQCLVSFSLSNEVSFTTPIPPEVDDCFDVSAKWINLAVLNGSIALISYHVKTTTFHVSILGQLGFKESWIKLFMVGPLPYVERPIGVGTKGKIFFIRKDNEVAWFDLSTQMIEVLGYTAKSWHFLCMIINYEESIVPFEE
jgi:molecular chaperone HtpG